MFDTIDYRRAIANAGGSSPLQVGSSGGRPFVAFYDATRILREGLTEAVDATQAGESVDSGLCVPLAEHRDEAPAGVPAARCKVAFDAAGRHLRHPAMSPRRDRLAATAYASSENIDNATEKPGQIVLFDARTALLVANLEGGLA